jgi:pimeloyl-ACP methyl ester carboxylesterase
MVVGGAFSFDWGLIQPEVTKFTRVCTYDPSGTAWSDPYRSVGEKQEQAAPHCAERVAEIHSLLKNAGVPGPYVLVGFSIGGLVGRFYTQNYPQDVAGMVVVDHAFIDVGSDAPPQSPVSPKPSPSAGLDSPPVLISSSPITLGLEDDRNFSKLPQRDRDLHTWAMSLHSWRPTAETAADCSAAVERAVQDQPFPFGDRPLIVIRTNNDAPAYGRLQEKLLRLSRNSTQVIAENSSHMIIIDEPQVVTTSIREVVQAIRNGTK